MNFPLFGFLIFLLLFKKILCILYTFFAIELLIQIVQGSPETDQLAELAEIIHTMPGDNVPYFLTLIRFQYSVVNKKS